MNRAASSVVFAAIAVLCAVTPLKSRAAEKLPNETITPALDSSLLVNPGKGFVEYGWADPAITEAYIGVGYNRFNWSSIEPADGVYDWKPIDDFIASFEKYGKKAAFGVMNVSTGIGCEYVTPKWVFDDGAEALTIPDSSTVSGMQIIPKHWDDPVFLSKMHAFVAALGRRYDGNPNLQWIDVRSYGNWGEGHVGMLGGDPNIILTPPNNLQKNYFEPYFDAFPHTQLIIPWGSDYYDSIYDWAVSAGAGMRRDGILSQYSKNGSECIRAYGHAPAVYEYCSDYATTKKLGYWSTSSLMDYIQGGKPSYMQWDTAVFQENRDFILMLGNKIGYHFVLQKAVLPGHLQNKSAFPVQLSWLNDGLAPIYQSCHVALALLAPNDTVVRQIWLDQSNPQTWLPNKPIQENLTAKFPDTPSGTYRLAIGLFINKSAVTPAYKLGITGRTSNGWYALGSGIGLTRP